jgi:hypothetical protein
MPDSSRTNSAGVVQGAYRIVSLSILIVVYSLSSVIHLYTLALHSALLPDMSSQVYIEPVFPGAFSTPNRTSGEDFKGALAGVARLTGLIMLHA